MTETYVPTQACSTPPKDAADWGAMLAVHDRWLRTIALSRLGCASDVHEVMQELALCLLARPPADVQRVEPFLYRLVVRYALLHRRKQGRQRRQVERYAERFDPAAAHAAGPLDWLLARERCELVRQALRSLAPRDAEILLLKYAHDWSYRQIAERLGLSESAVEARLHRARDRMRRELARKTEETVAHV